MGIKSFFKVILVILFFLGSMVIIKFISGGDAFGFDVISWL